MFGLLILNILGLWPAASASPEDRGLILLWVFIFLFIPNTILVGLALRINGISRESGLRRILIEQVAAEQRRRSIQSVAISTLPAIGMVSPILVQKQILILDKLGLVVSGQGFVSLTTLGWARVERKEKTVKLTENFTMNDMSNTFNNSPIGNASFVVNSENVSVQQTQGSAHVDLNQLAEQLPFLSVIMFLSLCRFRLGGCVRPRRALSRGRCANPSSLCWGTRPPSCGHTYVRVVQCTDLLGMFALSQASSCGLGRDALSRMHCGVRRVPNQHYYIGQRP